MRNINEIKIGEKTLKNILDNHNHWLMEDCEHWEDMKANLDYGNLMDSDLMGSNLRGSDLISSNLVDSDLSRSDLSYCNLSWSNLSNSNLSWSILANSDLSRSDLMGSNLTESDLSGCNLNGALLDDSEKIRKGIKLKESIIGWKKCKQDVIVKLEIPRGAIVFSINNNKCRTDKAIVKEIIGADRAYSMYKYFSYYVGDKIEVYDFNCEYNIECAEGIHFFKTREEAEKYRY